jgi:hypothetical protein
MQLMRRRKYTAVQNYEEHEIYAEELFPSFFLESSLNITTVAVRRDVKTKDSIEYRSESSARSRYSCSALTVEIIRVKNIIVLGH